MKEVQMGLFEHLAEFPPRNEVHVFSSDNGHLMSTDCWCEPQDIKWHTNKHGIKILVVDHPDLIPSVLHYEHQQDIRDRKPDWIDQILSDPSLKGSYAKND